MKTALLVVAPLLFGCSLSSGPTNPTISRQQMAQKLAEHQGGSAADFLCADTPPRATKGATVECTSLHGPLDPTGQYQVDTHYLITFTDNHGHFQVKALPQKYVVPVGP